MADITMTAASIVPVAANAANNAYEYGISNAAIAAGQTVYWDPSTGLYGLFDTDSATVAVHTLRGLAVSSAPAAGSAVVIQVAGTVACGSVLTAGRVYCGGAGTAGGVAANADLASGDYIHSLGIAISATVMELKIHNTGVVI
jgi:hypothetical protein